MESHADDTSATVDAVAQDGLAALRAAAPEREWAVLQTTLGELLARLPLFAALSAVIDGLTALLPMVETRDEYDTQLQGLPRQLLSGVMSYGFAPDQLPDQIITDYHTPGAAQFMHAVLELCRATQRERPDAERPALLVSAAGNAIIAAMSESFYSRHPDLFTRVRDNRLDPDTGDYTDPDAAKIPILLWMDAEVAALDTAQWLALADRVERAYAGL
ncbi:MAG: hypothetical protein IT298_11415 [Chloroflexi bacterium]|nr:hypothetical protein [Chloroflexota bacterium]MBV6437641.1 hypothetical protein [Anaerolineae bacterium]MDL1916648.1 hypothetical protein [Anaerolineae bacterium CFX4]OQY86356.1 MAG: hypothetical protein B6D42_01420 [Anaerolineae bacterium UTCFX5]MCC6566362.1 hypothetical protein [Chloroflexota bacterium]